MYMYDYFCNRLRKLDNTFLQPSFIFSLIALIVILPIGYTIDKHKLVTECSQPPHLYIGLDLQEKPPKIMKDFFDSAKHNISIVYFPVNRTGELISPSYLELLKSAHDRGVYIQVMTNDKQIGQVIQQYCTLVFPNSTGDTLELKLSFAIADNVRTIFPSYIFQDFNHNQTDFVVDFDKCPSVANDMAALFETIEGITKYSVFPRRLCPGVKFPSNHFFPGGNVTFAISPISLSASGRPLITQSVFNFFNENEGPIYLMTQALFPQVEQPRAIMPELLLSELIERAAVSKAPVKIIIPPDEAKNTLPELVSLMQIPQVSVKLFSTNQSQATLFIRNEEVGLMSMSFEYIVSSYVASLSIRIQYKELADQLIRHFNVTWDNSTPF